ncbi:MAG: phosphate signaling complex protein PhoU [Gammaproteobacteria bacterium]|nr:phosphate signaling complex protein PhoU [Gammaproteobacteria bacterium]
MDNLEIGHHISHQFDAELASVLNHLMNMGGMVEQQIRDATESLIENNTTLAQQVVVGDTKINALEVAIDEECIRILAKRQPTAIDLRLVIAIFKTITDLERIGDQAERIARQTLNLGGRECPATFCESFGEMSSLVLQMVHATLDAFTRLDTQSAANTTMVDDKVDMLYVDILTQLLPRIEARPNQAGEHINMMWATRALERIGDHSCNICEYVIYFVKGKDVRHIGRDAMKKFQD